MSTWINFLRKYGPIPRNDNMYDESIQRTAKRSGITPIVFDHPYKGKVFPLFESSPFTNIILTGTAGDGKTHLCREVWEKLGGNISVWGDDDPYISLKHSSGQVIHFIRDLSGWAPPLGETWLDHLSKMELMKRFVKSCLSNESSEVFMIAGNDGQLIEAFRRLADNDKSCDILKFRSILEELLVEDKEKIEGVNLQLFNLSRGNTSLLFERALDAFINHEKWREYFQQCEFKDKNPIFRNYNLLKNTQVRNRLHILFTLCDHNGLHLPIRQILLLIVNAVLGHPDVKECLMKDNDVCDIVTSGKLGEGCLYSNIFGGNLPPRRRTNITIFDYFDRFQIGFETTNRIDNLIIFGENDEILQDAYQELIADDVFYKDDHEFHKAKRDYIEFADEDDESSENFLNKLVRYRRSMFFRIPEGKEDKYRLWDLTVFRFAGDYINNVCNKLLKSEHIPRGIVGRLVKGLNRVFTGMLIDTENKLYLAESGSHSQIRVSRIFLGDISVRPSKGESVSIVTNESEAVILKVHLDNECSEELVINLVRFEFLSRVAESGALPASFSRECNEDILAFKSRLIAKIKSIREAEEQLDDNYYEVKILSSENGKVEDKSIEFKG